ACHQQRGAERADASYNGCRHRHIPHPGSDLRTDGKTKQTRARGPGMRHGVSNLKGHHDGYPPGPLAVSRYAPYQDRAICRTTKGEPVSRSYQILDDPARTPALRALRSTLEWLGDDVHYIANEVDPVVEMCTITKAFDNSKALVANRIKGYPGVRMISNLYSTKARTAKLHGMAEFKDIKLKILDCIRNPIAPKIVSQNEAPCQQILIPREQIRHVEDLIPIAQHTFADGARVFGA